MSLAPARRANLHTKDRPMTTATVDDLIALARAASDASEFPESEFHGVGHWQGVADQAIWLAEELGWGREERVFAFVFGATHDCRRENDDWDPEHGARAAQWLDAKGWMHRLHMTYYADTMRQSLIWHDKGQVLHSLKAPAFPRCAELGTLGWDADRSLLGRVGMDPDPKFFSLVQDPTFFQAFVRRGERVAEAPACWTALAQRALA